MRRALLLLCAILALVAVGAAAGLAPAGDGDERAAVGAREAVRAARDIPHRMRPPRLKSARCPEGVARCRAVTGRVVLVEAVDPDGDGDLHVVLAAGSVTAPGLTAVDVAPALRPRRDPRVGDRFSAAGPVQRGSFGQAQIHALDVATARLPRRPRVRG